MIKVSFCVPVYNREDKIEKCVESLINQTLSNSEYEVIVVDDCSTDDTIGVVENLFKKNEFSNGSVLKLDKNSGNASEPRNLAVSKSQGEYIIFVDSDDYVSLDTAENVYTFATEHDSDVVYLKYGVEGGGKGVPTAFSEKGTLPKADIVDNQLLYSLAVQKAFKRSEWQRLALKFDPEVKIGEDMLVTSKFIFNTKIHSVLADKEYYILVNHESDRLTTSHQSKKRTFKNYEEILDIIYAGKFGDIEYKHKAAARFINRIMHFGIGNKNNYLKPSTGMEEQNEWINLYMSLLNNHFPVAAEKYLNMSFFNKVRFLRNGNADAARLAIELDEQKKMNNKLRKDFDGLSKKVEALVKKSSDA